MDTQTREYGGFWQRFCALLLDAFILGIAHFIVMRMLSPAAGGHFVMAWRKARFIMLPVHWAYGVFFVGLNGATPGKIALGLKVVDAQGNVPGLVRALLREVPGKIISAVVLGLGFFWVAFDAEKRGWHDMIAGTHVIRA